MFQMSDGELATCVSCVILQVSANRRVLLELLPPVIILHLKCFVYNKDGCQKLFKDIDFDVDLELSKGVCWLVLFQ
jgi:hypothetical protein